MLHHVSSCSQCGQNFCEEKLWYKNEHVVERFYTVGDPLSKWGCSGKDFENMQIVRNSGTRAIYVVEAVADPPKDADTLHWVSNCGVCGFEFCNEWWWSANEKMVEMGYLPGAPLSEWGCGKFDSKKHMIIRNSDSGAIYVVEAAPGNVATVRKNAEFKANEVAAKKEAERVRKAREAAAKAEAERKAREAEEPRRRRKR
jgi:hypothetical protein